MSRLNLLKSNCIACKGCDEAVVLDSKTNRWFITMGHIGFNLAANNSQGFSNRQDAINAMAKVASH